MITYFIAFSGGFAVAMLFSYFNMLRGFNRYKEEAKEKLRFYARQQKHAEMKFEQMRVMSHNILTPLHGVRGMADNISKTALTDEQVNMVQEISEQANEIFVCLKGICRFHQNEEGDETITEINGASVLLVEDDLLNQKISMQYFENVGVVPDIANNGREAVEMVQKKHYDVVIMDLSMPDMDGIEATRLIRQLPQIAKSLVIIGFTANSSEESHQACIFAGMNDYLTKPATQQEILHCLQKWLPESAFTSDRDSFEVHEAPIADILQELQQSLESQSYSSIQSFASMVAEYCEQNELGKLKKRALELRDLAKSQQLNGGLQIFFELKASLEFMERLKGGKKAA